MINIKFTGQEELQAKIKEALKKYPKAAKQGVKLSCITVEKKAKYYVPVDTGRLKSSITYEVIDGLFDIVGTVGTNVEYAAPVELGHVMKTKDGEKYIPSQPYLLPALYDSKADILKIFEDVIKGVEL